MVVVGHVKADHQLQQELAKEDPTVAGWESEALHTEIGKQLKLLAKMLISGDRHKSQLTRLVASELLSTPLRPVALTTAYADKGVTVLRQSPQDTAACKTTSGEQLIEAFRACAAPRRVKFKVVGIDIRPEVVETTVDVEAGGQRDGLPTQVNAVWSVEWTRQKPHRMTSIEVTDYEEVSHRRGGRLAFEDATAAVLGSDAAFNEQLIHGYDYWRARTDRALGSDLAGNHGIAVGDANGDGLDDLYVTQPGGLPNRLLLQQTDGTAVDGAAAARVDYLDFSRAALFLDIDNDNDQDLLLGLNQGWLALENDGAGQFSRRVANECPGSVYSLAAADYDNDGDLDLYVCGRYPFGAMRDETRVQGLPLPYHDANNGGPGSLWRNDGDWKFRNVTAEVGLDANNRRFTFAASWEDYDNDGDQDLYLANDFGRNNLYRNDGGQFVDVAAEEQVEDIGAGMSASWGDADNDGHMDLYVGNMFSSAGFRVAYQEQFLPQADEQTRRDFQRHARGNSLFLNRGPKTDANFEDVTLSAKVNVGRWAWGSLFADLNNDGREDLFVANGFITTDDTKDL